MRAEELLAIIRRIMRDFSPLLPGMRLEVVSGEAFKARLLGRPILPVDISRAHGDEEKEKKIQVESDATRARGEETSTCADTWNGMTERGDAGQEGRQDEALTETPSERSAPGRAKEAARDEAPQPYPMHAFPSTRVVMVDIEGVRGLIGGEDRRLQRVLAEGMILREVIYLATCRQALPDPKGRAETIFRRHWPFQYAALRSAGFLGEVPVRPRDRRELVGEN